MTSEQLINLKTNIELLTEEEAFASISLNPLYQWAKIVVCDTDPNGNKQQITDDEFDNLIKTGINAPIKMAENKISDGHKEAYGHPIGVISNLKKEGNQLIALAALWKKERPSDISLLKDMYENGNPPNVSWEISYAKSEIKNGVERLIGCVLNGLAIVGMPAYQGRTPFVAMSSLDVEEITPELGEASVWTKAYINDLPDSAFLYIEDGGDKDEEEKTTPRSLRCFPYKDKNDNVDLPHLKNALASITKSDFNEQIKNDIESNARKILQEKNSSMEENKKNMDELEKLTNELNSLKGTLSEKETLLTEKESSITELGKKISDLEAEITPLREFKEQIDADKEKEEKLASIKTKFKESGLNKEDSYFTEKQEVLLKLNEDELDFMIQEMVSFAKSSESSASGKVPFITGHDTVTKNDLIEALKNRKTKS